MAETSQPQSAPSATEMHWGIAYLREDLQDMRQDMRHELGIVHARIDETNKRISETNSSLGERIDGTNQRIDGTNQRIDRLETTLHQRIDSRFALLLGAMITMTITMTGVILAAIKL